MTAAVVAKARSLASFPRSFHQNSAVIEWRDSSADLVAEAMKSDLSSCVAGSHRKKGVAADTNVQRDPTSITGGQSMQTRNQSSKGPKLGDMVAALYELGSSAFDDRGLAGDLAARQLGRLLARGRNERLTVALTSLARDLTVG